MRKRLAFSDLVAAFLKIIFLFTLKKCMPESEPRMVGDGGHVHGMEECVSKAPRVTQTAIRPQSSTGSKQYYGTRDTLESLSVSAKTEKMGGPEETAGDLEEWVESSEIYQREKLLRHEGDQIMQRN